MSEELHPPNKSLLAIQALQVLLVVTFHVTAKLGLVTELVSTLLAKVGDGLQVNFVYVGFETVFAVISLSAVGTWKTF